MSQKLENMPVEASSSLDGQSGITAAVIATTPPPPPPASKSTAKKKEKQKPQEKPVKTSELTAPPPPAPAPVVRAIRWPYGVGEKVTWVLRYGVIEGGVATLSVEPPMVLDGEPVIHYKGLVKSSKLLEFFYKINNEINTYVRVKDHLPLRQEIQQNESGRWGRRVVIFDQNKNQAKFFQDLTKSDGGKDDALREDPMTPFAQDIFGSIYFFRFLDSTRRVSFPIHDRYRNWANELTYLGDEKIRTPAGEFDTHHFKMFPRVSGSITPKGDVEIWTRKDDSNLILKFTAKIKVGSLTGEVTSIEPGTPLSFPPPELKTPTDVVNSGT